MKVLKQISLDDIVIFDIETVQAVPVLEKGTPLWDAWEYKMKTSGFLDEALYATKFNEDAALYPEFAKIVCITIGKIVNNALKVKSYYNDNEALLLESFCRDLTKIVAANKKTTMAGHAIKGFDIPWIVRRCFVNQIPIPNILDFEGLKPWEINVIDTLDLWKSTAFNGASLIAIAIALGLDNPKEEIAGYQTSSTYYNTPNGLEIIKTYCEKDVLTTANIIRKLRYEPIVALEAAKVEVAPEPETPILTRMFNTGDAPPKEVASVYKVIDSLPLEEQAIGIELLELTIKTK